MAIGDDAAAAGLPLVDGATTPANTLDTEINATRDMIARGDAAAVAPTAGKTVKRDANGRAQFETPAAAKDAATKEYVDARAAEKVNLSDVADPGKQESNQLAQYDGGGRLAVSNPTLGHHATPWSFVQSMLGGGAKADGPTSEAYNRANAGNSWFAVYMNAQLQFMRNTSSRRYKKHIRDWAGTVLGLRTVIFDRRGDDTPDDEVGFIAEEVGETLPEALLYFDGKIDGINDRVILAAAVATIQQLHRRIEQLETRMETT